MALKYFQRFGHILEAKIIREKLPTTSQGAHKGCAFLRCAYYHEAEGIMKMHRQAQRKRRRQFGGEGRRRRQRSESSPSEQPSLSSGAASPPPKREKEAAAAKDEEDEDTMATELFGTVSKRVLSRLQVRFADGELERLGIVNLSSSPGQQLETCSKLYVCHIHKGRTFEEVNKVFA
jgi:hypothetical protein